MNTTEQPKLEPQEPAEGISLVKKYDTWRWYRIPCECGCDEKIDFSVEIEDPEYGAITAHVSSEVSTPYWRRTFDITYQEPWLVYVLKDKANGLINRFKICWEAITKGQVKMESYVLMSEQQAINLANTLTKAVDEMREEAAKIKAKRQNTPK